MRLWLLLILLSSTSYALSINEVMYNPSGSDANREWIEIYNNDSEAYNISDWTLVTDNTDHSLNTNSTNEILLNGSYIVFVQNISAFLSDYPSVTIIVDSSWTSLSNSEDETILINNISIIFDNFTYSPIAAEGKSICRNETSYYECEPSPGFLEMNQTPSEGDCDIEASIDSDLIFEDTVHYNTVLSGNNCSSSPIEYWIEDLFGSVVRYFNTTQSCSSSTRQWTPDEVSGSEAYTINLQAYPVCNDTNTGNNNASKTIIIKGTSVSNESSLLITETENGSFGESINVDLDVYRGDTSKYAVKLYVRDSSGTKVSFESSAHVLSKYVPYKFSVPVQIKTYCSSEFKDGVYTLVAEGLDKTDEKNIFISGVSNCKTVTISSGGGGGGGFLPVKESPHSVTYPGTVSVGEEFDVIVRINSTSHKKYTVYSYVFKGNTPVSEGFNGEWKGTWTANTQEVIAEPSKTTVVVLKSRIEEDTVSGTYSLRVKIKSDKDEEITKYIEVKEKPAIVIKNPEPNQTLNTSSTKVGKFPVTGLAIAPKRSRAAEILPLLNAILRVKKLL